MPTLAQITKALADRIRSIELRRRDVYDEANRLVELEPFRRPFKALEEGELAAYQVFTPPGDPYNEFDKAGSQNQFAPNGFPDHRVDLYGNFNREGSPTPYTVRNMMVRSLADSMAVWTTSAPHLFPLVVFRPGELAPVRSSYGMPVVTMSGNARLELYFDTNTGAPPSPAAWFPLQVTVELTGRPTQVLVVPHAGHPPVYQPFPSTHVKERFDAAWLGQKGDTQYPKAFIILDDGAQRLEASGRAARQTSFLVMFVCKQGPTSEDGSPVLSADAPFGWPYGSESEQVSQFIQDFDLALKADDTLGGTVMEARMEGFVSDSGLAHPEGAVWIKVEVEYHA